MIDRAIEGIIDRYFLTSGYNIVNTLTYGLLLGFAVFGIIPLLKRMNVKFDKRLNAALIPFIFFGATARELFDQKLGVYGNVDNYGYLFVTPGIYVISFLITFSILALSLLVFRKNYQGPMFFAGLVLAIYNFSLIVSNIQNVGALVLVVSVFCATSALVLIVAKAWLGFLFYEKNYLVVLAHLLDASATFVGVDFLGFREKHVLPNFLIEWLGSAVIMFPLKLLVVIPALYVVDKELKDDETGRRFVKLVILILGMGPALRDTVLAIL